MRNPRETIRTPISDLEEEEMYNEIIYIIETLIPNPKLVRNQAHWYNCRVSELLRVLPDSENKTRLIDKLRAKKRFSPYLNDSGIIDLTGYGEHLY